MTSSRQALDQVLENLKQPSYIAEYLSAYGYDVHRQFRCPNPDHPDKRPSAGLIKQGNRGWCFSCHTSFDLFDLAVWLEGRPSSGPGWVTDTVKYLADRFHIPFETPDLSREDLREMEVLSAYSHAYQIIRHTKDEDLPARALAKVQELRWNQSLRYKMGIGAVESYDNFIHRMTVQYKHSLDLLKSCDLAIDPENKHFSAKGIFNENALIFTIRDENGSPVGFSARNLLFEEQKATNDKARKYVHTREDGTLFRKSRLLYNLDQARKVNGPIEVVEGNPDCVTLVSGGQQGTVGTLGTAFTHEHLELLLANGKRHLVVAMDNDQAGKDGVARVVNLVKEVAGNVGIRLEVRMTPDGVKDPDLYVRAFETNEKGVVAWRKLEVLDLFSWSIKHRRDAGEDPLTICETTIPLIVNETSNLVRMQQARQLAKWTNTSESFVEKEVLRLLNKEESRLDEERQIIADNLVKKLRQDPSRFESYVSVASSQLEAVNKRKAGYNPTAVLGHVDLLFSQKETRVTKCELLTGYPLYDRVFDGIPRFGTFMMLPGKPHHGKSNWMDNLVLGLGKNNKDLRMILHTVDDSVNDRINRLLGAYSGMPSEVFRSPGYYLNDPQGQKEAPENFSDRYHEAKEWIRNAIVEERLMLVDTGILPQQLEALRAYTADMRRKHSNDPILVFGDNFHLYGLRTDASGEEKISQMSSFMTNEIVTPLEVSVIVTVELPKAQLTPGIKPSYLDIKGSGSLSFDVKACNGVYNQLQDWVSDASMTDVWWEDAKFMETVTNSDGSIGRRNIRKPILEVIIDKNKVSGRTKSIFYRLENVSGRITECSEMEQQMYLDRLAAGAEARKKERGGGNNTRSIAINSRASHRAAF